MLKIKLHQHKIIHHIKGVIRQQERANNITNIYKVCNKAAGGIYLMLTKSILF